MTTQARDWLIVGLKKVAPKITTEAIKEFISLQDEINAFDAKRWVVGDSRCRARDRRYDKQQIILDNYR